MASLNFLSSAKEETVTDKSKLLLTKIADDSNNVSISISSTARSPYDQARIMYDNCKKLGIQSQYNLYARTGDKVIDVYKSLADGKTHNRDEVIRAMMNKINAVGPSKVSKHCVDTTIMNVLDVPFSSIENKADFKKAISLYMPSPITRLLDETNNNCFHIEIDLQALNNMSGDLF